MSGPVINMEETHRDCVWRCNGCQYRTRDLDAALHHAEEASVIWPFEHILYERPRADPDGRPRRRIVIRAGTAIAEVNPRGEARQG